MDYIKLSPELVSGLNWLYKHLLDDPAKNPTNTPKITPNGTEVKTLSQVSKIMGVDTNIAAHFVLQDPNANETLKTEAKEVAFPGVYLSDQDSFDPVLHQAYEITTKDVSALEQKRIRMVRTVSGVRRFRQGRGSIIVTDGEPPLNALVALPNDVRGYEKVASKGGRIFYVGHENGKWVVRDPRIKDAIFRGGSEEEAFRWLNKEVGGEGGKTPSEQGSGPVLDQAEQDRQATESERADRPLSDNEQSALREMGKEDLNLYKKLRQRGLGHTEVLALLKRPRKDQPPK